MSRALYKILVDDLLSKLARGEIRVGERLPPEEEYAQQVGVSRSTLRKAFEQLEYDGILKRRKRGGTEVIADKPVKRYRIVAKEFYDVLSVAQGTTLKINDLYSITIDAMYEMPGIDSSIQQCADNWLAVIGNRYLPGQEKPFAALKVYVPEQFSDLGLSVGDQTESVLVKIESEYGVIAGGVKREISADKLLDFDTAEAIGLDQGDAVLTVQTKVSDSNGELLEIAYSIIDPEKFHIMTDVVVGG